ncbi:MULTISPECIES: ATP-dependent nuclease [unclassified Inquilinus]|uniref:ATP-dependent nuclease n=1 Tax=unclassified Inquilinus TaxID=2645927 RepID=UPI003F8EAE65
MNLIKKIEINYLRSLYSATLNDVGNINIVFGRNDSGKSNLLRALNLFFKSKIEPSHDLSFELDMSDTRRQEAQKVKGRQFIWIKITFNVPENFRKSLGQEVTIKRQWNRDGDATESIWPHKLTRGQTAQLTKFRNQIDFTYIPAVKDLEVYADLIERMYGAASETQSLQNATKRFVEAIQTQTTQLSGQLTTLFGSPARLAAPAEMRRLFRTLDFAHGEEGHSLLRQKGDGIKARHLPELLRFINQNETSKKFFIWGFEEPENSLDLGAAEAEARRFVEFSDRSDTQIFITSHSPAFYLANSLSKKSNVKRFFITKQKPDPISGSMMPLDAASSIDDIDEAEKAMDVAGLLQLPFVIRRLSELQQKNEELKNDIGKLHSDINKSSKPTLFVEGKHDKRIFSSALNRIGLDIDQIDIHVLGGTPKSASELLKSLSKYGGKIGNNPSFFLFDNDRSGRSAYRDLCREGSGSSPFRLTQEVSVWVLPMTDPFKSFLSETGIPEESAFFTSEFLFPVEKSKEICLALTKSVSSASSTGQEISAWRKKIHAEYWNKLSQDRCIDLLNIPDDRTSWFYLRGVPDGLKERFAEKIEGEKILSDTVNSISTIIAECMYEEK